MCTEQGEVGQLMIKSVRLQSADNGATAFVLCVTTAAAVMGSDSMFAVQALAGINVLFNTGVTIEAKPALGCLVAGFVATGTLDLFRLVCSRKFTRADQIKQ